MSFDTSPKKKDSGLQPLYGDTEAAVSVRMRYSDDCTLTLYKQQARQDVEDFRRMFAEAGVGVNPELADPRHLQSCA
jgi:hypothetical protein